MPELATHTLTLGLAVATAFVLLQVWRTCARRHTARRGNRGTCHLVLHCVGVYLHAGLVLTCAPAPVSI